MIYYSMQYNQAYFHRVHFRTDLNFEQTYFDLSSESYIKPQKKEKNKQKRKERNETTSLASRRISHLQGDRQNQGRKWKRAGRFRRVYPRWLTAGSRGKDGSEEAEAEFHNGLAGWLGNLFGATPVIYPKMKIQPLLFQFSVFIVHSFKNIIDTRS